MDGMSEPTISRVRELVCEHVARVYPPVVNIDVFQGTDALRAEADVHQEWNPRELHPNAQGGIHTVEATEAFDFDRSGAAEYLEAYSVWLANTLIAGIVKDGRITEAEVKARR